MMKPEGSQIEKSLFERSAGLLEALGLCRASEILEVRPLAGGVASDIAAVRFGARTVCVKFALPKLRVAADWYAPVSRGRSEFNWLLVARAIVPEATPELFGWSDEHGGFAMEFLSGPDVHVWKAALLAGIVGLGRIGRVIAKRLTAFDMEIHYTSRSEKETPGWIYHADPVSLAEAVDYLIMALLGGPKTENYVSKEVLAGLGPRGILVNISRGSTVDEGALLDALENGTIAGAGLDVFLNEPKINPRFLKIGNVVLQPHQGTATVETRAAMGQLQRDNISAYIGGDALLTPIN